MEEHKCPLEEKKEPPKSIVGDIIGRRLAAQRSKDRIVLDALLEFVVLVNSVAGNRLGRFTEYVARQYLKRI